MREEILKMRKFEHLNNEKITLYFLSLAKKPSNMEDLSDICNDDGTPFDNPAVRDIYMKNYYAATYRKLPDTVHEQSISNFLGDVAHHPDVVASKLCNEERDYLERDLTLLEFHKAIEKAKINTSPGIDSISNRFIRTFWHIFRVPLFNYANSCYEKGMLSENFRCAKIRLIPKKGNPTLLKKLASNKFVKLLL
jgi:hypothetical protein